MRHVVKKIIIIAPAVILLLGGTGGGFYAVGMPDELLGLNQEATAEGKEGRGDASSEGTDAQ